MNALVFGLGAAILGTAVHLVALRHLAPKWRLPALPLLLLIVLGGLAQFAPPSEGSLSLEDGAVALVLTLSLGFAYALVLNGVLYDSPTLALVNAIEACGPDGMPLAAFDDFVARHPFVQSRLRALITVGELTVEQGELRLTGNAVHLLRVGDAYRRLRGGAASQMG